MSEQLPPSANQDPPGPQAGSTPTTQTRKKRRWGKVIISISIILTVFCCSILVWGALKSAIDTRLQKPPVEAVIDQFMQAMKNKNVDEAYAVFAQEAHASVKPADLEKSLSGSGYAVYNGYESTTIPDLSINEPIFAFGSLNRTTASANGYVSYGDGTVTSVEATLLLEEGEWKLMHIFISIAP